MANRQRFGVGCVTVASGLLAALGLGSHARANGPAFTSDVSVTTPAAPKVSLIQDGLGGDPPRTISMNVYDLGENAHAGWYLLDETASTAPFWVQGSVPTHSLVLSPEGRTGLGTQTPLTNLHGFTNAGPYTFRMQDASVVPNIWDVEGGGLGFNVKDFSGGTTPFSILPDAPTNSLFVSTSGRIGLGTATPDANSQVDIRSGLTNGLLAKRSDANPHYLRVENSAAAFRCGVQGNGDTQFGALTTGKGLNLLAGGTGKVAINSSGQISFGSTPPAITTHALVHTTNARLTAGGTWTNASSRAVKQDIEPITSDEARETVRALQPVGYRYKNELDERYVGFIAEDVPELVATRDRKGLAPMDIVGVLTKVVQDQDVLLEGERKLNAEQRQELDKQRQVNAEQQELLVTQHAALAALTKRLDDLERKSGGSGSFAR